MTISESRQQQWQPETLGEPDRMSSIGLNQSLWSREDYCPRQYASHTSPPDSLAPLALYDSKVSTTAAPEEAMRDYERVQRIIDAKQAAPKLDLSVSEDPEFPVPENFSIVLGTDDQPIRYVKLDQDDRFVSVTETHRIPPFEEGGGQLSNVHAFKLSDDGHLMVKRNDGKGFETTEYTDVRFDENRNEVVAYRDREEVRFRPGGERVHRANFAGLEHTHVVYNNGDALQSINFPKKAPGGTSYYLDENEAVLTVATTKAGQDPDDRPRTQFVMIESNDGVLIFEETPGNPYQLDVLAVDPRREMFRHVLPGNIEAVRRHFEWEPELSLKWDQDNNGAVKFSIDERKQSWKESDLADLLKLRPR